MSKSIVKFDIETMKEYFLSCEGAGVNRPAVHLQRRKSEDRLHN
jgi:hypothetical protein